MTVFCEECKHLPNCELAKHEEVDTCKKGEKAVYDNCDNKCEKCEHIRKCKLFRDYCGYLERKLKEELDKNTNSV